ncbi:MAG: hypothetical protein CMJ85_04475 [Planctomycetes bacterium]|nr:hypothetical protein [Planctomycetota bacterium]MDP6424541.1 hypothetical protein [Planctomycetota bacterium]
MGFACLLSLVFPVAGLVVMLVLSPEEGFDPDTGYLGWFIAGGVAQGVAALMFLRPKPSGWRSGWFLLWVASVAYMGAYADVWLQHKPVAQKIVDFGRAGDLEAVARLMVQESGFNLLEWTFAVLFVTAFFTIAAFVTKEARAVYGLEDRDVEDPLAFKAHYGIQ